jgi:hypothetical protein
MSPLGYVHKPSICSEWFVRRTERALRLARIARFVARTQSERVTGAEDAG